MKAVIKAVGKTSAEIAEGVKEFCLRTDTVAYVDGADLIDRKPKFYGYYADYDWCAFCWLFGKMIDLPTGFPMYCIDLKQTLDEKATSLSDKDLLEFFTTADRTFDERLSMLKTRKDYPQQTNEHNARADARWNKALYEFLKSI